MNTKIFFVTLLISFFITLFATKKLIPILERMKIGQKILEIGPSWHKDKNGTPTMGGVSFVLATVISFLVFFLFFQADKREIHIIINVLTYALLNSCTGAIDDIAKIRKHKNEGLTPMGKLLFQSAASIIFLIMMKKTVGLSTTITLPFAEFEFELGVFYYVFAFLLLCGMTNAVNLTDGIDGLASTCIITVGVFLSIVSITKYESIALDFFGAIMIGTAFAFLFFNLHPAKIFMGDTGSLFYGAMVVSVSFVLNSPLLVLLYGFVFLCEALSVILQVGYFKLTKGKRLLKMAPLHHHFERCGYSEMKIVTIFGILSAVFCAVAYMGV